MEQAAFLELYERSFRRVYNYISYRINNHDDVEDLVSSVFMRALQRCDTYDETRGGAEAWVIGIAHNAIVDHYRHSGQRRDISWDAWETDVPDCLPLPDDITIKKESQRCLMLALNALADRERQVIALKYGAELSNREIARHMGLSVSNIGVMLYRSLRKLRSRLGREERS